LSAYSDFALKVRRTGGTLMTAEVLLLSMILIGFGFFNAPITSFVYRLFSDFNTYLDILVGISLATSKLHFYTSGQMYRMKDIKTREKIGPLLLPETSNSQAA